MKNLLFPILVLLATVPSFGQSKYELGFKASGSWFIPGAPGQTPQDRKTGLGTGLGIYASHKIWGPLSGSLGLDYRFTNASAFNQYKSAVPSGGYALGGTTVSSGYGYETAGQYGAWKDFRQHALVVPIKFQLSFTKSFYIETGIETNWTLNYDYVDKKPDMNWLIGFGSKKYVVDWSINYIRGISDQTIGNTDDVFLSNLAAMSYRTNLVQLNISYPLHSK